MKKIWVNVDMTVYLSDCMNSSHRSTAYIGQQTGSALVQVMACRMIGVKPLPEPMLTYCLLNPWKES